MKNRIVLFIVGFIVWGLLHHPLDKQHALVGIIVALAVTLVSGDLFTSRPQLFLDPRRYLWFSYYIVIFIWEWIKTNIKIAFRLVRPDIPLKPAIIKIKTELKTDIALTFLANTLTLASETITVDLDKEKGGIYLHCIETADADNLKVGCKITVERFEKIIKKIFE
jgi:multicomponent Na+:H+ antiporter subunit E